MTMVVTKGRDELATRLVALAERALASVRALVPSGWPQKVLVVAVDDPAVYGAYVRDTSNVHSASTMSSWESVPEWSPRVYEYVASRVFVNPQYLDREDTRLLGLFAHEFTHVALGGGGRKQHRSG